MFLILLKSDDENEASDNRIIPQYATGTLDIWCMWLGCSMGNSRKKTNSERRDMEFPGVSKKSMWNFQELIKNKKEFPRVTEKKVWNFQGTWFLALEFSMDLTQFCRISRAGALFYLEFQGVKKWNILQGVSKMYVLNPPAFFWNSPTHSTFDPRNWITSSMKINVTVIFLYIQNNLIFQNNFKGKYYILKGENIKSLWLCYHSNKLNLTMVRDPCKWGCNWIIKFFLVWILDIINMLLFFQFEFKVAVATCCMQEGKHLNNIWHFFKKN